MMLAPFDRPLAFLVVGHDLFFASGGDTSCSSSSSSIRHHVDHLSHPRLQHLRGAFASSLCDRGFRFSPS